MANMYGNIGLDELFEKDNTTRDIEDDVVLGLLNYVYGEGKEFRGYGDTRYHYKDTGTCEFWLQSKEQEEGIELESLHTHGGNMLMWDLRCKGIDIGPKDWSIGEYFGMFSNKNGNGLVPIDVINADVVPSFMDDDEFTVQIIGFPLVACYYKDEEERFECESFEAESPVEELNGKRMANALGSLLPIHWMNNHIVTDTPSEEKQDFYKDDLYVNFSGKVEKLLWGTFGETDKDVSKTYLRCFIRTNFGPLELYHTIEQVPEEQRENMEVGAIISGVCILSGDVAIGEYGEASGAVKDFEHDLRLLRYVFSSGKAEKLYGTLAEDAVYASEASGQTKVGKGDIIERLKYVHENKKNHDKYAYLATITEAASDNPEYPVGTRCVVLSAKEYDEYESLAFIEVNDEGLIQRINVSTGDGYRFSVDPPFEPVEDEDTDENADEEEDVFRGKILYG